MAPLDVIGGVLAYTFQIYFDFSGYSDMAIGLAIMFGLQLPINFYSPYKATSVIEFWRRWHISLSTFLRDYLYVRLGGSRAGRAAHYRNLMLTMLIGGLWHGAAWTFVFWGGLHGAYLLINHMWRGSRLSGRLADRVPAGALNLAYGAITFAGVVLAWVFFRADTFTKAVTIIRYGFGGLVSGVPLLPTASVIDKAVWLWLLGAAAIAFLLPNTVQIFYRPDRMIAAGEFRETSPSWLRGLPYGYVGGFGVALLLWLVVANSDKPSEFIYWSF